MPFSSWQEGGDKYDWYQVGGRYTGLLSGYEPDEDPANIETCPLCHGTGTRPDGIERFGRAWSERVNGCNGCYGKGTRPVWPVLRKPHDGDYATVADVLRKIAEGEGGKPWSTYAVLTPDGRWRECMSWTGEEWERTENWSEVFASIFRALDPSLPVTVVDCHF